MKFNLYLWLSTENWDIAQLLQHQKFPLSKCTIFSDSFSVPLSREEPPASSFHPELCGNSPGAGFLRGCANSPSLCVGRRIINKAAWKAWGTPYGWLTFKNPFISGSLPRTETFITLKEEAIISHVTVKSSISPTLWPHKRKTWRRWMDVDQMWHKLQVQFYIDL